MNWIDELEKRTGVRFEAVRPMEIEERSFQIIGSELPGQALEHYPKEQLPILKRVIHTTADFSYLENLYFSEHVISHALEAVKAGIPIVTDTAMAAAGINKRAAGAFHVDVRCYVGDERVARKAGELGLTRSALSVDQAAEECPDCIYAVGNAPTALMRLYELIEDEKIRPRLVIGVPVGFVNVVEAKELIIRSGVPCIVARGRKGGSNVAAAVCNALLYMAGGREPDGPERS